jgi:hypothetical protein
MPYEITTRDDDHYEVVKWTGNATREELLASGVEAVELAGRLGIQRILIDVVDVANRLNVTELFLATDAHSKLGPPRPRAALLGRSDQERELRFIETVGFNRGMPIKAFTDEKQAMSWLLR